MTSPSATDGPPGIHRTVGTLLRDGGRLILSAVHPCLPHRDPSTSRPGPGRHGHVPLLPPSDACAKRGQPLLTARVLE